MHASSYQDFFNEILMNEFGIQIKFLFKNSEHCYLLFTFKLKDGDLLDNIFGAIDKDIYHKPKKKSMFHRSLNHVEYKLKFYRDIHVKLAIN